jgi:hypothetical protein
MMCPGSRAFRVDSGKCWYKLVIRPFGLLAAFIVIAALTACHPSFSLYGGVADQ